MDLKVGSYLIFGHVVDDLFEAIHQAHTSSRQTGRDIVVHRIDKADYPPIFIDVAYISHRTITGELPRFPIPG